MMILGFLQGVEVKWLKRKSALTLYAETVSSLLIHVFRMYLECSYNI